MEPIEQGDCLSESKTEFAWSDAEWVVLHERKAVMPKQCVVCCRPATDRPLKMLLWKPISPVGCLFFGWLAFVGSQSSSVKIWLCRAHRAEERRYQWMFRCLVGSALCCLALGLAGIFYFGARDCGNAMLGSLLLVALVMPLALVTGMFVVMRPRLVYAKKIDRPFVWVEDVHPAYLAQLPELPPPSAK